MGLCKICANAVARIDSNQNGLGRFVSSVAFSYPPRSHVMTESCWICQTITDWTSNRTPQISQTWQQNSIQLTFTFKGFLLQTHEAGKPPVISLDLEVKPTSYLDEGCYIELIFLPSQDFPSNRSRSTTKRSMPIDLHLIERWLHRCTNEHMCCKSSTATWYPTRLLQLGHNDQTVRLIISDEKRLTTPYATLSHRWGQGNHPKLKKATIDQMKIGLEVQRLPPVFQDAIYVVRGLGIRYLWIDSLCIIQDDSDWDKESQLMHRIYGSAMINISATASMDGSESLLRESSRAPFLPYEVSLTVDGSPQKYFCIDGDLWSDEIVDAPLNQRAWVLQERFLAQRVIHFGPRQLAWECNELEALEMFPNGLPPTAMLSKLTKNDIFNVIENTSDIGLKPKFGELWRLIMEDYTARQLTFSKDRLRALEGMASYCANSTTDVYYAGMWERCLIKHLVWQCLDINNPRRIYDRTTNFARAPSWSWASLDIPVRFPQEPSEDRIKVFIYKFRMTDDLRISQLTSVAHRQIQMIARSLPLRLRWTNGAVSSFNLGGIEFEAENRVLILRSLVIEHSEQQVQEAQAKGNLFWIPIYMSTISLNGIIVIKIRGRSCYMRVGTGLLQMENSLTNEDVQRRMEPTPNALNSPNNSNTGIGGQERPTFEHMGYSLNLNVIRLLAHIRDKESLRFLNLC